MAPYKRQHYLPAAYLKYFSVDQNKCDRDALVWRFDGEGQRLVPVKSQCHEDYFYSKEKAEEIERMFKRSEDAYCRCVDTVKANRQISDLHAGTLLMFMFDLYLRNAIHENQTGEDGYAAYLKRNNILWYKLLRIKDEGDISVAEIGAYMEKNWGLGIVSGLPGHHFLTSDHPSVYTSVPGLEEGLHMLTLPITPTKTAIAYDRRFLRLFGEQVNSEDEQTLNSGQMANSFECLYVSGRIPEAQMPLLQRHFSEKSDPVCVTGSERCNLEIQAIDEGYLFSFIQLLPPRF